MTPEQQRFMVGGCTATLITTATGQQVRRYVLLSKTYRDQHGNLRPTNALYTNDLPKAILALQKAYDHLTALETGEANTPLPAHDLSTVPPS